MGFITHAEMRDLQKEYKPQYQNQERRRVDEEVRAARLRAQEQEREKHFNALRIKRESVVKATYNMSAGFATADDYQLIMTERELWRQTVLHFEAPRARYLVDNQFSFPLQIQQQIQGILPILKLKAFSFTDNLIQRLELTHLLLLAQEAFLLPEMHSTNSNFILLTNLRIFIDKSNVQTLNEQEVLCLLVLLNDYEKNISGAKNLINNLIVYQIRATVTIGQLVPKNEIPKELNINPSNFSMHLDQLTQQIATLPLDRNIKKTINTVIVPGIMSIIHDEDEIIRHVRNHYGRLYYLNEKLPLHTDHVNRKEPEEYRNVLHRLLINFFGAAHLAYNKGLLLNFCEKISLGYCFEGRVEDVFMWATSLPDLLSFDEIMEKYFSKEYLPYSRVITESSDEDILQLDPAIDFIMNRHKNEKCISHTIYAPYGVVTQAGVKKYLTHILDLTSQRDFDMALKQTRTLRKTLENSSTFFWNRPWRSLMHTKIDALNALEKHMEINKRPDLAAKEISHQFPDALQGSHSRTKKLLMQFEEIAIEEGGSSIALSK